MGKTSKKKNNNKNIKEEVSETTNTNCFSLNIISKYRNQLYGFAILWIVFFHAYAIDLVDYSFGHDALIPLKVFMNGGNVGVDIFLFLSGICLYFSYFKNPNSYEFLKKRMVRIVFPVWIIDGLYWLIRYVFVEHAGWSSFINRMLLLQFWEKGDSTIWFVSCIAVFYFLYPYIHQYLFSKEEKNVWLRGILLLGVTYLAVICFAKVNPQLYANIEIALTRLPVFILGCIVGKFVYEDRKLPSQLKVIPFLALLLFLTIIFIHPFGGYRMRFFYLIGGVSIAYTMSIVFEWIDKHCKNFKIFSFILNILSAVGQFSLELYLSHIMVNQVYRLTPFYVEGDLSRYLVVVVIAIIIAYLASKISKKCSKIVLSD